MNSSVKQRELSRRGCCSGSFLFFYGKTRPNSQHKTPRVTPLGVFCFSQCFRHSPTDRVPRSDSLFAEPISGVRSQPAGSPPTPPKSPLQLLGSLLNTPLRVHNPVSPGGVLGDLQYRLAGQRHVGSAAPFSWHLLTNVCLRPVRPVLSAWHEMPGQAAPDSLRPVGAVLSRTLRVPCEPGVRQRAWVSICSGTARAVR